MEHSLLEIFTDFILQVISLHEIFTHFRLQVISLHEIFTDSAFFRIYIYYKIPVHCMKFSQIGSDSENSENFMQRIIIRSTTLNSLEEIYAQEDLG